VKYDIQISACLVENNLNFGVLHKSRGRAYAALHRQGQQPWLITLTDLFGHCLTVSLLKAEGGCRWHPAYSDSCSCNGPLHILYFNIFLFFLPGPIFQGNKGYEVVLFALLPHLLDQPHVS